ncbi:MAG TPA: hypothetical protein VGY13_05885 [Solirubrobacteraceae bacterium]|nr:hypothetical protein [Solirubrobacteraceae bacterium]
MTATIALAAALALGAPASGAAETSAARAHHAVLCQHRHGHTLLRRGAVRVFEAAGPTGADVYGCVKGAANVVSLWEAGPETPYGGAEKSGAVKQVAGRFVAAEALTDNQYEHSSSLTVFDLRDGASYELEGTVEPISQPSPPKATKLERFVLGGDGHTAALYATYAPSAATATGSPAGQQSPTGQELVLLGFRHFEQVLASGAPASIAPASLAFNGAAVSWSENGVPRSAAG